MTGAVVAMLGIRSGGSYDADAEAYFARMGTQPDATRKGHISDFFAGLKTDGDYTSIDQMGLLAGHNATDALLWMKSTGTATAVSSPTFTTDRGYAGDGSASYINTGWAPSTHGVQYTQNSAMFGLYLNDGSVSASSTACAMGCANATTNRCRLYPRMAADGVGYVINGTNTETDGSASTRLGFTMICRTGSGATESFRNGASQGTGADTSGGLSTQAFFLGGRNNSGSLAEPVNNRVAFWIVGAELSATAAGRVNTRVNTLLTAIGAN